MGMFDWRARQSHHAESRDDKSQETRHQPLPISAPDKIKSNEDKTHPEQQASEKPEGRTLGRNSLAHCPPKTAKENGAEKKSSRQSRCQN
jgi:hypothetical protein